MVAPFHRRPGSTVPSGWHQVGPCSSDSPDCQAGTRSTWESTSRGGGLGARRGLAEGRRHGVADGVAGPSAACDPHQPPGDALMDHAALIMLLSRSRAPGAVSARWVPTQAGDAKTVHPGEPVVPVGSLALTHLAPPQAVELLSWSAVGRDLCHCDDATALGCQATATSTGLAAAYPPRDERPGGARTPRSSPPRSGGGLHKPRRQDVGEGTRPSRVRRPEHPVRPRTGGSRWSQGQTVTATSTGIIPVGITLGVHSSRRARRSRDRCDPGVRTDRRPVPAACASALSARRWICNASVRRTGHVRRTGFDVLLSTAGLGRRFARAGCDGDASRGGQRLERYEATGLSSSGCLG